MVGPVYVAMRRFSVTVRFGKIPRPSGIAQIPARARASDDLPLADDPKSRSSPELGAI